MPQNEQPFTKKGGHKRGKDGEKRERILSAAISVFAQKGFYATRVSEIAKAAGVADGTIYLYFENKEDVLISIFRDRIGKLVEVLKREVKKADSVEDGVRRIVDLQLGLLEGERDLAEVITVNLRQSSSLLKQYAVPLFREYLDVIAGVIARGQESGAFRQDLNPKIVARALWGGLDGIALTWALTDADPSKLRRAAQQYATLFLEGVVTRP